MNFKFLKKIKIIFPTIFILLFILAPAFTHAQSEVRYCYEYRTRGVLGIRGPFKECFNTANECSSAENTRLAEDGNESVAPCTQVQAADENSPANNGNPGGDTVGIWDFFKNPIRVLALALLTISGWLLWLSGLVFNLAINTTVVGMAEFVKNTEGIEIAWKVIRDLMNMLFIFILLYVSISMILKLEGLNVKKVLTRIVIVGLLINFSLFFTRIVIDGSNILAFEFYQGIVGIGGADLSTAGGSEVASGITGTFVKPLKLSTLYSVSQDGTVTAGSDLSNLDGGQFLVLGVVGSIFILITAFAFLTGAMLLIIRFGILIFLMILSPFAFFASILPKTEEYSKKWWGTLFNQAFFAPIFLLFLLVVAVILNTSTTLSGESNATFSALITGNSGSISLVINFLIIIVLVIASIVIAKKLATDAGTGVVNMGTKFLNGALLSAGGIVGRNTIGRGARKLGETYDSKVAQLTQNKGFQLFTKRLDSNVLGKGVMALAGAADIKLRGGMKSAESAKFGGKKTLKDVEKERRERMRDIRQTHLADQREQTIDQGIKLVNDMLDPSTATAYDPNDTNVKDFFKQVGKISDGAIKEMLEKKLDTFKNESFASALSSKHIAAINKAVDDGLISESDKNEILDARTRGLVSRLNRAHVAGFGQIEINNHLSGKSKAVANLPKEILTDGRVAKQVPAGALREILNDDTLERGDRTTVRTAILGEFASQQARYTSSGIPIDPALQAAYNWLTSPGGYAF